MVTLLLDHTRLEIALSPVERVLALRRDAVRVERAAITKVQLTADPWTWLRGIRAPGTHIPGVVALGTWRSTPGDDFVAIRGRGRPGVVIDLEGDAHYQRLVLTTRHGLALARALRLEGGAAADEPISTEPVRTARRRRPRPAAGPAPAV